MDPRWRCGVCQWNKKVARITMESLMLTLTKVSKAARLWSKDTYVLTSDSSYHETLLDEQVYTEVTVTLYNKMFIRMSALILCTINKTDNTLFFTLQWYWINTTSFEEVIIPILILYYFYKNKLHCDISCLHLRYFDHTANSAPITGTHPIWFNSHTLVVPFELLCLI